MGRKRDGLLRELREEVMIGIVDQCMHRVESQSVDVVVLEPVPRVVQEESAYGFAVRAVEVHRVAPRRLVPI